MLVGWSAYQSSVTVPASRERSAALEPSQPDAEARCDVPGTSRFDVLLYEDAVVDGSVIEGPVAPARDCAVRADLDPRDLSAYWNASDAIVVVPSDRKVPASWRPFEPAVLELHASLGDYVDGLQATCLDVDDGRAFVEGELRRLGLEGWRVTVREVAAGAASRGCVGAAVHHDDREVEVIPGLDADAQEDRPARLADRVRTLLTGRCVPPEEAEAEVRELIPALGLNEYEWSVVPISDDDAQCTVADINYFGPELPVYLRGPVAP